MSQLTEEESRVLAKHIVAELISRLSEEENVTSLAKAWGKQLDQWLGKNFRRFLVLIMMFLSAWAAVKLQVWTAWTK